MSASYLSITTLLPFLLLILNLISPKNTNPFSFINKGKKILLIGIALMLSTLIGLVSGIIQAPVFFLPKNELFSLRLDTLSTSMYLMVSIIGFIVLSFSKNYLQGDPKHLSFIKRMLFTLAFVQLLVLAGSLLILFLSWVMTSLFLQSLIGFYKERKETELAVKKKFTAARISDLFLLFSFIFLYFEFGTGNLNHIFLSLKNDSLVQRPFYLELSAIFLVLAAAVKSVQIPFHGWILHVMESPTPVSAILHAGLLNAGPFLIIRFAFLLEASISGSVLLLMLGGLSALYGTIVSPSQHAVKTRLSYSSIGHMGFSLMICGLGLYSASLLHLISHTFYKAHSFLASGSEIDKTRIKKFKTSRPKPTRIWNAVLGLAGACILYFLTESLWKENGHEGFGFTSLGLIIICGVSSFLMQTFTFKGRSEILFGILLSGFVLLSFFTFESAVSFLVSNQLPVSPKTEIIQKIISIILMIAFAMAIFAPFFRSNFNKELITKWKVYTRNGFYIHLYFDRLIQPILPRQLKINKIQ